MASAGDRVEERGEKARARELERALEREFSVVCFAWDGTAVAHRGADAAAVRSRVERLTALGVDIAVISSAGVRTPWSRAISGSASSVPVITRCSGRLPFSMMANGVDPARPCAIKRSRIRSSPATPM